MLIASSTWASGGGDEFSDSVFAPTSAVDASALPGYVGGQLGVLQPGYSRIYLFFAWRAAQAQALSPAEAQSLTINGWQSRPSSDVGAAVGAWLQARQAALEGLPPASRPAALTVDDPWTYAGRGDWSYLTTNCAQDAFVRARQTLAERQQLGAAWPAWGGRWLTQQDQVFAQCRGKADAALPAPPPDGAPSWLRQDHAYQLAAAHFYQGDYATARAGFQAVAQDITSSWHTLAAYLAARCLIREVSFRPQASSEPSWIAETLGVARTELVRLAPAYPPATDLVGWIDMRLRPAERLKALALQLDHGRFDARRQAELNDYLVSLAPLPPQRLVAAAEPMTRWIGVMQAMVDQGNAMTLQAEMQIAAVQDPLTGTALRSQALAVARAQWQATHAPVWLVPLLSQALPPGPKVPPERLLSTEERQAALAVPPSSPLYQHLRYHLLRLRIAQGDGAAADAELAALLVDPKQPMGDATRNRFLGLKVQSASTLPGFLATAPRRIVLPLGRPIIDADRASRDTPQAAAPIVGLDGDFLWPLYHQLPLAMLMAIRQAPELATERQRLTEVIWTRAVLLGQWAVADSLVDELARPRGTTQELWRRFKAASTPADKRDAATVIWVNTPELHPGLNLPDPQAYGECNSVGWSLPQQGDGSEAAPGPAPAFLSTAERAQAAEQLRQLRTLKDRNPALAPALLAWAKAHRDDPEAPKALHFFIASTRKECRRYDPAHPDAPPPAHPREAFELLHKLWPKSEWAKQTKYYY
ncbi:MAG TPA: hypothetical protein VLA61_08445 [Ideonella sp.]|uniref:hypothetical protein n=1 Tax=Ideonella sp. TaxID=1929293 RepID=UPI002B50B4AE|nr:hypothetical protein [Ideonella sp.]HSI48283.1 hypothetical protein [Ideonella sp.]